MAFPSNTPAGADPAGRLQEAIQLFVQHSGPGTRVRALAAELKQLLPPGMERQFLADAAVQQAAHDDDEAWCVLMETPGVDALLEQDALRGRLHRLLVWREHDERMLTFLPALFSQPAGQCFLLEQPELLSHAADIIADFNNFNNWLHPVLEGIFGAPGVGARHDIIRTEDDHVEPAAAAAAASFIAEQPVLSRAVVAAAVRSLGQCMVDGDNIIPAVARLLPVREALLASEGAEQDPPPGRCGQEEDGSDDEEVLSIPDDGLLDRLLAKCITSDETLCKTLLGSTDQPLTEELVAAVTRRLDTRRVADGARFVLAHLAPGST